MVNTEGNRDFEVFSRQRWRTKPGKSSSRRRCMGQDHLFPWVGFWDHQRFPIMAPSPVVMWMSLSEGQWSRIRREGQRMEGVKSVERGYVFRLVLRVKDTWRIKKGLEITVLILERQDTDDLSPLGEASVGINHPALTLEHIYIREMAGVMLGDVMKETCWGFLHWGFTWIRSGDGKGELRVWESLLRKNRWDPKRE